MASKALEKNTGARGLRTILESILLDTMFTLPGIEGVDEIVVNADVVEKSKDLSIYIINLTKFIIKKLNLCQTTKTLLYPTIERYCCISQYDCSFICWEV